MSHDTHTSQVLSNKWAGLGALAVATLLAFCFSQYTGLSLVPIAVVNIRSLKVDWYHGLLLTLVWAAYMTLPLYLLFVSFLGLDVALNILFLAVYSPLYLVLGRSKPHSLNSLELLYLKLFWDPPLLIWQHIIHYCQGCALKPFYSDIAEGVAMGSLPFSRDALALHAQQVCAVVNMCRESSGPVDEYRRLGITQLRLPTPDLCSPSIYDIITGVRFMRQMRLKYPEKKVFVHCKGGRGRAATLMLCYLISHGWDVSTAIRHMKEQRSVVASVVVQYPAVQEIVRMKKSGELETLFKATDEEIEALKERDGLIQAQTGVESNHMDRERQRKKND